MLNLPNQKLIDHISISINNAEVYKSKLVRAILNFEGMSSNKVRHFLNNVCHLKDINYLEVGVWRGSTFCSATYNNPINCAIAIDNFSEFNSSNVRIPARIMSRSDLTIEKDFRLHLSETQKWSGITPQKTTLINSDFNQININNFPIIDIYFYDGAHDYQNHYNAFNKFNNILNKTFITLIDDWNSPEVKRGTKEIFRDLQYKVIKSWEMFGDHSSVEMAKTYWWNGFYIALINK